jgi:DNA-binding winged helix-turn-helix (wHTH) protein/tetratricopeptide (TPR) repeat protein
VTIYAFGDFELDPDARELRRGDRAISIEPQVLDLLAYLVRHRDRVVSREELVDAVWGHRYIVDATLGSRVKAARRAIGDSGAVQRYVRTLRGRGLRFVGEVVERAPEVHVVSLVRPDLVGRSRELRELRGHLTAALAGRLQVAFVTGEGGAGKSALLDAFLDEAARVPGVRCGRGQCVETTGPGEPYLPLLEALGRLAEGRDGADVVATLRERAPGWVAQLPWLGDAPAPVGATAGRMLREALDALTEVARERAIVLALEDLHWADPSTLEVLAALARRRDPVRLLVLATYRDPAPSRLRSLAADLRLHGNAAGLALEPLDAAAVEALVVARGAPSARAAELHRRTGGNPLFVVSLLEADRDELPATLADLLDAEVAALAPEDQRLLEAGAVAGATFSAAVLDADDAEARCAALTREHRFLRAAGIEEWPDGTVAERFAFVHDLRREAVRARLTAGRRCALHRRIGARLEAAYGDRAREIAADLAAHFVAGREPARAVVHLRAAADVAIGRGAHAEAVEHLELAARLAAGDPGQELAVQTALAPALVAMRGWDAPDALAAYRRARELSTELGAHGELSRALYGLATLEEYRANYVASEALVEERLQLDGGAPDRGLESHELLACSLFHQGRFAQAVASADRAVAAGGHSAAACTLGEDPEASAHGWAALALWFLGDDDGALERAKAAVAVGREPSRAYGLASALAHAARVHQHRDEPAPARDLAAACVTVSEAGGFPYFLAVGRMVHGWATGALTELREGLAAHAATGAAMDRPYFLGLLADALARAGQVSEAVTVLGEALAGAERPFFYRAELLRQRAELTSDRGTAEQAARLARAQGAVTLERRAAATIAMLPPHSLQETST